MAGHHFTPTRRPVLQLFHFLRSEVDSRSFATEKLFPAGSTCNHEKCMKNRVHLQSVTCPVLIDLPLAAMVAGDCLFGVFAGVLGPLHGVGVSCGLALGLRQGEDTRRYFPSLPASPSVRSKYESSLSLILPRMKNKKYTFNTLRNTTNTNG